VNPDNVEEIISDVLTSYTSASHSLAEFNDALRRHGAIYWVLTSLAHEEPSSLEKERAFLAAARRHSETAKIEAYYRTRLDRLRAREPDLTLAEIRTLFAQGEGGVLHALAGNPQTPDDILSALTELQGVTFARETRRLARENLRRRQQRR
jgi:hypothetical protein